MNLQINFNQMQSTDAIKRKISEKSNKLSKYFNGKFDITWTVSADKAGHHSHITLKYDKIILNADSTKDDLYKTFDDVVAKIEKQLLKYKDQLVDKIHHKHDQLSF